MLILLIIVSNWFEIHFFPDFGSQLQRWKHHTEQYVVCRGPESQGVPKIYSLSYTSAAFQILNSSLGGDLVLTELRIQNINSVFGKRHLKAQQQ